MDASGESYKLVDHSDNSIDELFVCTIAPNSAVKAIRRTMGTMKCAGDDLI